MGTPFDVAFGRLAVAQGLVPQEAVRLAYQQLPPGRSLKDELVARRALAPDRAQALEAWLREQSGAQPVADEGATLSAPAPASGGGAPPSVTGRLRLPGVGDVVAGRYQLEGLLGKGGMGAVFRARDRRTGELHAMKVLLPTGADAGRRLARFEREAQALAKVDAHAGIIRVRALGEHEGLTYALMDLVVGRDLDRLVEDEGPLEVGRALRYTEAVARAVHYCHVRDVLHRDLKPANVLLREADDTPLVMDFGLALDEAAERLTKTGEVMGTPAYMSPEQADGAWRDVDARTDVYALGAILHELVTGEAPFRGSPMEVIAKVFTELPPLPSSLRPGLPADLDVICRKAMAKDKALRYATAEAFADDVGRLARGEPITARPISRREELVWRAGRGDWRAKLRLWSPVLVGIVVVAATAIAAAAIVDTRAKKLRRVLARLGAELDAVSPLDPSAPATDASVRELVALLEDAAGQERAKREKVLALVDLAARDAPGLDDLARVLRADPAGVQALRRLARRMAAWEGQGFMPAPDPGAPEDRLFHALSILRFTDAAAFTGAEKLDADLLCAEHGLHELTRDMVERRDACARPGDPAARAILQELAAQDPGPVGAAAREVLGDLTKIDEAVHAELEGWRARLVEKVRLALGGARASAGDPWKVVPAVSARAFPAGRARRAGGRAGEPEEDPAARRARQYLGAIYASVCAQKPAAVGAALRDIVAQVERVPEGRWKQRDPYDAVAAALVEVLRPFAFDSPPRLPRRSSGDLANDPVHRPAVELLVALGPRARATGSSDPQEALVRVVLASLGLVLSFEEAQVRDAITDAVLQPVERAFINRRKLPVEIMALTPAMGLHITGQEGFLQYLKQTLDDGDFEAFTRQHRMGDAYMAWAQILDRVHGEYGKTQDAGGMTVKVNRKDVQVMQKIRDTYAAALGDRLDADTRARLGLAPALALDIDLTRFWVGRARAGVADYTVRIELERNDRPPSRAVIEAALAVMAEQRRRDDLFATRADHNASLHIESDLLEEMYTEQSDADPPWKARLLAALEAALTAEMEKGFDMARAIVRGERRETAREGSLTSAEATMDVQHLRAFLGNPAIELAEVHQRTGRAADGERIIAAALREYEAMGAELPFPAGLHLMRARLLLVVGRPGEVEAVVAPVLAEALQRPGADPKSRAEATKYRSLARALLAHARLDLGDEAAARAVLAEARRDGDPLEADHKGLGHPWPPVLKRLGE